MRPMAGLRHVLLAAVFAALQLSNGVLSQVTQCVFPTSSIIGTPLLSAIRSSGGEGGSVQVVTILDMQVTCLAVNEKDVYRQASVVVRYDTDLSSMTNVTGHLTIECGSDDLYIPNGDIEPNVPESLFNTPTRYDCAACLTSAAPGAGTYDPDTNCIGKPSILILKLIVDYPLFINSIFTHACHPLFCIVACKSPSKKEDYYVPQSIVTSPHDSH